MSRFPFTSYCRRPMLLRLLPVFCLTVLYLLLQGCSISSPDARLHKRYKDLPPIRAAQIDLDYVYDSDPAQQQANLELLLSRVKALGIDTVFLQAFADPEGNGVAESLYFQNSSLPMREDLFIPTARALRQNNVAVYGWLPMLAYSLPGWDQELYVQANASGNPVDQPHGGLPRLSPFNSRSREIIRGIYREFAEQTMIDGILFHDDGVLSDFEDASPAALRHYRRAGFPADLQAIRKDRSLMRRWSRYKTTYLIDFSLSLFDIVRSRQPGIRSVRNIFAGPILQPESETWFAQSLTLFLKAYDYTALMAMPFMEQAQTPNRWLEQLAWAALDRQDNPNRIIFELQTRDWRTTEPVAGHIMRNQIILLSQMGVTSFAYYPDDFHNNMPPADLINGCLANPEPCTDRDAS